MKTPTWLEEFCDDEKVTLKRVEVAWEGQHVALVKKLRPVRWHVIDKTWSWIDSPAREETYQAKPLLNHELFVGRLNRPDFERLLERVQRLDAKYPELVVAKERSEKARKQKIAAERRQVRQQAGQARTRARRLRSLLQDAEIEHSFRSRPVMGQSFELDELSIELGNGMRMDVGSNLTGLTLTYVGFDLPRNGLTPEQMFALVKKLAALKLPKGIVG